MSRQLTQPEPVGEKGHRPRVGFIVAGVQKAGTTTLYGTLREHPQVARSRAAELHFFDDDTQDWSNPDYQRYERWLVAKPAERIAGVSTPSCLFWPGAMQRVHAYNPRMRFVLSFRDPIERAFSQWCMNRSVRPDTADFSIDVRRFAPSSLPASVEDAGGRFASYVARGCYGAQLRRSLELFEKSQLLLLDYHLAFKDFEVTVDRLTDFLGVDRFEEHPVERRARARPSDLTGQAPTAADIVWLTDRFATDLRDFGDLAEIDVASWPTMQVASGRLAPADLAARLATSAGLVT